MHYLSSQHALIKLSNTYQYLNRSSDFPSVYTPWAFILRPDYTWIFLFAFYKPTEAIFIEKFSNFCELKIFAPLTFETPLGPFGPKYDSVNYQTTIRVPYLIILEG